VLKRRVWRRLWQETRGYRPAVSALLLLDVCAVPLALLTPVPLAIAVDSAIGRKPVPDWLDAIAPPVATSSSQAIGLTAALLLIAIALLEQLRGISSWLLGTWTGQQLLIRLRARLFRHSQRMSLAYHDRQGTTDATFRIQYDAEAVQHLATDGLNPIVTSVLTLLAMIWVTVRIDPVIALIALCAIPALVVLFRAYQHRLRSGWSEVKSNESSAMAVLQEALGSLRVVKAFGGEHREASRYEGRARQSMRGHVRMTMLEATMWLAIGLTLAVCSALVLYVGVLHVDSGELTTGDLVVVVAYAAMISGPLEALSRHAGTLQSSLASAERAYELLDQPRDVEEQPNPVRIRRLRGKIEFRHVMFQYGTTGGGVDDVSFRVPPGACVGLSGTTGSGKTTLMNLLIRFYDPDDGQVLIDDVDIRNYPVTDLRNQFGIVLQEPVLFSTTIGENIAYASPLASRHEVELAARAAEAHDFIVKLPDGYDTVIGERGHTLSGGQRQRLSVARAFLKNAPILVLDEPTSAVDIATEDRIMTAVRRLVTGRTTFLASHRPRVLALCDGVLRVDHGRVSLSVPREPVRRPRVAAECR
jgi:ATP-binding cassette subfamily B protein